MVKVERPINWKSYSVVKGVGIKTIERLEEFSNSDDPFGILGLTNSLAELAAQCPDLGLPQPTHTGDMIPYDQSGDVEAVYMGIVKKRNLKDIFESHRAKTGQELDPQTVKDPHKREFVVLTCWDGTEVVTVRIDRWKYSNFKKAIWGTRMEKDIILVRGVKPNWRTAREIYANEIWVINPDDDQE